MKVKINLVEDREASGRREDDYRNKMRGESKKLQLREDEYSDKHKALDDEIRNAFDEMVKSPAQSTNSMQRIRDAYAEKDKLNQQFGKEEDEDKQVPDGAWTGDRGYIGEDFEGISFYKSPVGEKLHRKMSLFADILSKRIFGDYIKNNPKEKSRFNSSRSDVRRNASNRYWSHSGAAEIIGEIVATLNDRHPDEESVKAKISVWQSRYPKEWFEASKQINAKIEQEKGEREVQESKHLKEATPEDEQNATTIDGADNIDTPQSSVHEPGIFLVCGDTACGYEEAVVGELRLDAPIPCPNCGVFLVPLLVAFPEEEVKTIEEPLNPQNMGVEGAVTFNPAIVDEN